MFLPILEGVKQVKENTKMIGKDRNSLKQHDVLKVTNVEKFIRKKTHDGKQ
jgi:hypothetical protein